MKKTIIERVKEWTRTMETDNGGKKTLLFGMEAEKGRWVFIALGLAINICLGAIYSWSVFRKPLEDIYSAGATESLLPFIIFLATFAVVMPLAGRPLDKYGPKKMTMAGGALLGCGWILGSMAPDMLTLSLTYGLIGGAGVGMVYNSPIGVAGRWFPERRGLAVGMTVLGFGLSPFITAPLANHLISLSGPLTTLGTLGVLFLVVIIVLGLPLRFPPEGWSPRGYVSPAGSTYSTEGLDRPEMLKTRAFWGLWLCYTIGTLAGLMAIGISSSVGQEVFALSAGTAAMMTGIFAIFNGIGRPIFGHFVDSRGPRMTAVLSFILVIAASLLLATASGPGAVVVFASGFSLLWLTLGGWLAIAPAATASLFGMRHYGTNYGIVFTAYGVGAIAGNLMAGNLRDLAGSYTAVFFPVALLAGAGAVIAFLLIRPPEKKETGGRGI